MKIPVISDLLHLAVDLGVEVRDMAVTNASLVTVRCYCGETWSYLVPDSLDADRVAPECPACLRETVPM